MSRMRQVPALFICLMLISGCSILGIRSEYEQPDYEVIEQLGELIEIRSYEPRTAAEATLDGEDIVQGRNAAFRLLFDYISGTNQINTNISMTTPVESADKSEVIAMSSPVETSQTDKNRVSMRFFLPSTYDRETAPKPRDARVKIISIPAQTVAALRFSGFANEEAIAAKKKQLLNALPSASWKPVSKPTVYFYDPPWTIPYFRRNEVVVPVVR